MSVSHNLLTVITDYEVDNNTEFISLSTIIEQLYKKFPCLSNDGSYNEFLEFLNALSVFQHIPSPSFPSGISPIIIAAVKMVFSSPKILPELSMPLSSWCLIRIEPSILEASECIPTIEIFQRKLIKANTDL